MKTLWQVQIEGMNLEKERDMTIELISTLSPAQVEEIRKAVKEVLELDFVYAVASINDDTEQVAVCVYGAGPDPVYRVLDGFKGNADFEALDEFLCYFISITPMRRAKAGCELGRGAND